MNTLEHSVDIPAPPDAVWRVPTDLTAYAERSTFVMIHLPSAGEGERLNVIVCAGPRKTTFRPTVTVLEPGGEPSPLGRLLMPGLAGDALTLLPEPVPNCDTLFHREKASRSVIVPFLGSLLRRTDESVAGLSAVLSACLISQLSPRVI